MKSISIDIETYSSVNLARSGVYRYTESEDFEILLFGFPDGKEVNVIDLTQGEKIPEEIIMALQDEKIIKWAFNAMFEICLSKFLGRNRKIFKPFILEMFNDLVCLYGPSLIIRRGRSCLSLEKAL